MVLVIHSPEKNHQNSSTI